MTRALMAIVFAALGTAMLFWLGYAVHYNDGAWYRMPIFMLMFLSVVGCYCAAIGTALGLGK